MPLIKIPQVLRILLLVSMRLILPKTCYWAILQVTLHLTLVQRKPKIRWLCYQYADSLNTGFKAGFRNNNSGNTLLGANAGLENTGNYNVFLGYNACKTTDYANSNNYLCIASQGGNLITGSFEDGDLELGQSNQGVVTVMNDLLVNDAANFATVMGCKRLYSYLTQDKEIFMSMALKLLN